MAFKAVKPKLIVCLKRPLQPFNLIALQQQYIKPAGWKLLKTHQVMTRCKNDAPLFQSADAGTCSAVAGIVALAHLDKHTSAIGCTHDQIDFTATAPRRSIIAHQKMQLGLLQIVQRRVFSRITDLLGVAWLNYCLDLRSNH